MKTAEEWAKEICQKDGQSDVYDLVTVDFDEIKQIQLDAYKQGMTDAASILSTTCYEGTVILSEARQAILAARDKKETI